MLFLNLAESALEMIPKSLWNHRGIIKKAKKARKQPRNTLLDRTLHHKYMSELEGEGRRGRPDIVHFCLLEALGTPLNREGMLQTVIHTLDNYLIYINPKVRLPKNYNRFVGLMEQLYEKGRISPRGQTFIKLRKGTFTDLVDEINPSYIIAFSRSGSPKPLQEVFTNLGMLENLMVVVGAFPRGHLSEAIVDVVNELVSIDFGTLDASIVTSRIIYEYERAIGLSKKRLKKR
jgi:rRNA small subunit pseudouridine methyltransferase Nep1